MPHTVSNKITHHQERSTIHQIVKNGLSVFDLSIGAAVASSVSSKASKNFRQLDRVDTSIFDCQHQRNIPDQNRIDFTQNLKSISLKNSGSPNPFLWEV